MNNTTIIIIIMIICIISCSCSSSIALGGGYLYTNNKTTSEEKTPEETIPQETTPQETTPVPSTVSTTPAPIVETTTPASQKISAAGQTDGKPPSIVPGYSKNAALDGKMPADNFNQCRQIARKNPKKYVAWAYSNDKNTDPESKNTCFLYKALPTGFKGTPNDNVYITGCPFDFQSVESGCSPIINVIDGGAVKCDRNSGTVLRFTDGKLRGYPNPEIASSWDPNWGKSAKIINCKDIPVGEPMGMAPTEGKSVTCKQYPGPVFNFLRGQLRGYPSPEIASSWDPDWGSAPERDCDGIPVGTNLTKLEKVMGVPVNYIQ